MDYFIIKRIKGKNLVSKSSHETQENLSQTSQFNHRQRAAIKNDEQFKIRPR